MRDFVANHLDSIEPGLTALRIEFGCKLTGCRGRAGSIDILCEDVESNLVVLECKQKPATPEALGQVIAYMAWIRRHFAKKGQLVRGMIVATEITSLLRLALDAIDERVIRAIECPNRLPLYRLGQHNAGM